jgi:site-specific recombinase XerD
MTTTAIALDSPNARRLIPADAGKNTRHRLAKYVQWLDDRGSPWYRPDLKAYRDHLQTEGASDGSVLKPSSVAAHLATVRGRYRRLLRQDDIRDALLVMAAETLPRLGQEDTPANRKALADELIMRIQNAVHPDTARVTVPVSQDKPDKEQRRLTPRQANDLMDAPGVDTLRGLRDTAIISLMLCTGIREAELAALEVEDLTQKLGGRLALNVREGKGCKQRVIPYGELDWTVPVVEEWLEAAGIVSGAVFRGICKGDKKVRTGAISVRAVQYVLTSYPIMIDGEATAVRPHDLRRTYARRLYDDGAPLPAIQANLGHASVDTTLGYIGELDVEQRCPGEAYRFEAGKAANPQCGMPLSSVGRW